MLLPTARKPDAGTLLLAGDWHYLAGGEVRHDIANNIVHRDPFNAAQAIEEFFPTFAELIQDFLTRRQRTKEGDIISTSRFGPHLHQPPRL